MTSQVSTVKSAYFIIADISGYTEFMSKTAITHAKGILEGIFGAVLPAIRSPLMISGLQGDAVFAYAFESDVLTKQFIMDFAEQLYCVFARAKEKMIINSGCQCDACKNINALELKIVVHHGECVEQTTNDRTELAGQDVITAFRLLKNSVKETTGLTAYALITCDALKQMDLVDFFEDSEFHTEDIEHIGEVEYVVRDMRQAWERRQHTDRTFVDPTDDLLMDEWIVTLPVSPEIAFTLCTRPDLRAQWLGADKVDLLNANNGKVEPGTLYHCYHGDDIYPFEIVDWHQGDYATGRYLLPMGLQMYETNEMVEMGGGTMVKIRFARAKSPKIMGKLMGGKVNKQLYSIIAPERETRLAKLLELSRQYANRIAA